MDHERHRYGTDDDGSDQHRRGPLRDPSVESRGRAGCQHHRDGEEQQRDPRQPDHPRIERLAHDAGCHQTVAGHQDAYGETADREEYRAGLHGATSCTSRDHRHHAGGRRDHRDEQQWTLADTRSGSIAGLFFNVMSAATGIPRRSTRPPWRVVQATTLFDVTLAPSADPVLKLSARRPLVLSMPGARRQV